MFTDTLSYSEAAGYFRLRHKIPDYAFNPDALPANSSAERALRQAVLCRKSRGGTASEWLSRFVERDLSVWLSADKTSEWFLSS
jgi:hypothetical protein